MNLTTQHYKLIAAVFGGLLAGINIASVVGILAKQ